MSIRKWLVHLLTVAIVFLATGPVASWVDIVYDAALANPVIIPNPEPSAWDSLGGHVAWVGSDALVSAHLDDTDGSDAGIAYRFNPLTGEKLLTFHNPHPHSGDSLGYGLAAMGNDVLVGAHQDSTDGSNTGIAFKYDGSTEGPPLVTFHNPTPDNGDFFGYSIAAMSTNVVIGAMKDDTDGTDAGIVYVFDGSTEGAPLLTIHNPEPDLAGEDWFGRSVAVLGDKVVVGAHQDDTDGTNTGIVYVFDGSAGGDPLLTIHNPTPDVGDGFGHSIAVAGDNILVSAIYDDTGAANAGIAYLFDGSSGDLLLTIPNPTPDAGDVFGVGLGALGNDLLVGAPFDDEGANQGGGAYLFDGTKRGVYDEDPLLTILNPTPDVDDEFGWSVAGLGSSILIGASRENDAEGFYEGVRAAGAAYVFTHESSTIPAPTTVVSLIGLGIMCSLTYVWQWRKRRLQ